MKRFLLIPILLTFCLVVHAEVRFSNQEIRKIKQILNEMTLILEGNHQEILQIEDVLSRSGTGLRKARNRENLRRKINSFRDRLKDLKKVRLSFANVTPMKEFIIAIDDRLKVMEDNVALMEEIYFPVSLDPAALQPKEDDWPTFINPGDPRYELDSDQQKLARSIQKTKNLMSLRASREVSDPNFSGFVNQLDENLKSEHKPMGQVTPVLGVNTLDHFYKQVADAQKKDPRFDWNDGRNDPRFREFIHEVEGLDKKATVNKRVVTGFPEVDSPDGAKSRKTFQELVMKMGQEVRALERKKVVVKQAGVQKELKGITSYMNDSRKDDLAVARGQFEGFLQEMQPVHSEVILSYQKGIMKQGSTPTSVIRKKETLAWVQDDDEYLRRLRNRRVFEQADEYYKGELLLAERTRRKSHNRFFDGVSFQRATAEVANDYGVGEANTRDHSYKVANTDFFVPENSPHAYETGPREKKLLKHRLSDEKTLVPVTVQLLDEHEEPHQGVPMDFLLVLPKTSPKLEGAILEGGQSSPEFVQRTTDAKGEAKIHLLMNLFEQDIEIEREIEQRGDKVVCKVFVKLPQS